MSALKPPLSRLSDLVPGQRADFFALLVDRVPGVTQQGKPYFQCRFRDARRTVTLMVWSDDERFEAAEQEWQVGKFYKLRAVYSDHERWGPQIELHNIRTVTDADVADGFDPSAFVESSRHDVAHMMNEVRTLATKHIKDEPFRNLVLAVLEKHSQALLRLPASRDRAYAFRGGLLEHTMLVTQVAIELAERYAGAYPELRPPLNRDLVTAGAILHDIGRVAELGDEFPMPAYTVAGRMTGGTVLGRDLFREVAAEHKEVKPELVQLLEHILLHTPLYPPEGGPPRWPLIPEGLIVQYAVDLDVKMAMYVRCLSKDVGPGPFTERDPVLGRQLLKAREV